MCETNSNPVQLVPKKRRKEAGFTLQEIMIGMVIVGALSGLYKFAAEPALRQTDKTAIQTTFNNSVNTWRMYRSMRGITCDSTPVNNPVLDDTNGNVLELLTGDYTNVKTNMELSGAGLGPVGGIDKNGSEFLVAGLVHTLSFDGSCQATASYAGMPTDLLSTLYGSMEGQDALKSADFSNEQTTTAGDNFTWTAPSAAGLHDVTITALPNQ